MSQRQLEAQINGALGQLVKNMFDLSQKRVPVCTGKLKSSATFNSGRAEYTITYDTDYARTVEFGSVSGTSQGRPHVSKIKSHYRTTPSGRRVQVRSHTKTYQTGKPIKCSDGSWKTINTTGPYRGRFFLTSAVKDILYRALGKQNALQVYIR
tara:strand:+ start:112 stop:570 length:459 start_codon:yes stop_codon:yes gene_type:complete